MKVEQRQIELGGLPAQVLFDIARNPSADPLWRKAAVRMMLDKGYPQVNHEDLAVLVLQVRAEKGAEAEVESLVEAQIEHPIEDLPLPPADGRLIDVLKYPPLADTHEHDTGDPWAPQEAPDVSDAASAIKVFRNPQALADDALAGE